MDGLLSLHRKEAKDLQNKVTSKKKNASKKTRKMVNDECNAMEAEMKARQANEIDALLRASCIDPEEEFEDMQQPEASKEVQPGVDPLHGIAIVPHALEQLPKDDTATNSDSAGARKIPTRRNRQHERLARRAAQQEAIIAEAASEAATLPDLRRLERTRLLEEFKNHQLEEKAVAANGHCLYSSVADQLHQLNIGLDLSGTSTISKTDQEPKEDQNDYKQIRDAAATYIEKNPDEFEPFLEEPLNSYVDKVRNSAEWGGQLELIALAKAYSIDIYVIQAEGRSETITGNTCTYSRQAWLAYYRHGFGLGEHYNSLRKTIGQA